MDKNIKDPINVIQFTINDIYDYLNGTLKDELYNQIKHISQYKPKKNNKGVKINGKN